MASRNIILLILISIVPSNSILTITNSYQQENASENETKFISKGLRTNVRSSLEGYSRGRKYVLAHEGPSEGGGGDLRMRGRKYVLAHEGPSEGGGGDLRMRGQKYVLAHEGPSEGGGGDLRMRGHKYVLAHEAPSDGGGGHLRMSGH